MITLGRILTSHVNQLIPPLHDRHIRILSTRYLSLAIKLRVQEFLE